jgi:endoglucanase
LGDAPEGSNYHLYLYDPEKPGKLPFTKGVKVFEFQHIHKIKNRAGAGPLATLWVLDFSQVKQAGNYQLQMEEDPNFKVPVKVSDFVYWDTLKPVMRSFFLQRCGEEIEDPTSGVFHLECHVNDGYIKPSHISVNEEDLPFKDATGGWHDGSGYDKYVTSTGIALAHLLSLYEAEPKAMNLFSMDYPVTEPGIGEVPDYLHELEVGLDWLIAMQKLDGDFYRKVAGQKSIGNILPEQDIQPRYLYSVTTQDTAVATATLAMASRCYKKKDLGFAVKSLMAAEKGWRFLAAHPEMANSSPQDMNISQDYLSPESNALPHRVWAAAELYLATQKPEYLDFFLKNYTRVPLQPLTWKNPILQALLDYALYAPNKDSDVVHYMTGQIVALADGYEKAIGKDPYRLGMFLENEHDFSSEDLSRVLVLLNAYQLTNNARYRNAALENLNYLLGLNPKDQTLITGISPKTVTRIVKCYQPYPLWIMPRWLEPWDY